jgi:hypothetical protein
MLCPHCRLAIDPALIKKAAAQINRAEMKIQPRPKKLAPCKFCGRAFGVRDMKPHRARCQHNPRNKK